MKPVTDKEKYEMIEEKYSSLQVLFSSEKDMNGVLKKHIENLNFQLETQSGLLENFSKIIGDLRFKLKNMTFTTDQTIVEKKIKFFPDKKDNKKDCDCGC